MGPSRRIGELCRVKALLINCFLLFSQATAPHDFFVSICTIHHNTEARTLEVTWRMTTHDVEHALEPIAHQALRLGTEMEAAAADSLLADYTISNLLLMQDDRPIRLRYLGKEVELETTYVYLQAEGISDPEGVNVLNTLLFDLFEEQQNIVHLESSSGTTSHTFVRGSMPFTFTTPQ